MPPRTRNIRPAPTLPEPPHELIATRHRGTISIMLRIDAVITGGDVTPDKLTEFCRMGIQQYHLFRAGNMGLNADASIRCPQVTLIEPPTPEPKGGPDGQPRIRRTRVR